MKSCPKLALPSLAALLFFVAGTYRADAVLPQVVVYKVTVTSKAQFFPKNAPAGNSAKSSGYLIYDVQTPANSQTVEVFKNKTYQVNGTLLQRIFPAAIGLAALDRNNDGFAETLNSLLGFQNGNQTHARSYIGTIPKNGFFLKGTLITQLSKTMKGKGTVVVGGNDLLTRTEAFVVDPLTSALPNSTNVGRDAVIAILESKGFNIVP